MYLRIVPFCCILPCDYPSEHRHIFKFLRTAVVEPLPSAGPFEVSDILSLLIMERPLESKDVRREHILDQESPPSHPHVEYDATSDRRVRRKLDRNMMPLFFVLCECFMSGSGAPLSH